LEEYNECAEIAALCEPNEGRASDCNDLFESKGARRVPVYHPNDFAALVRNEGPDTVMITSGPDATHAGTGSGKTAAVGRSNR
jgi:predicted dehydrogenase